jgi:hypothetical protein
MGAPQPVDGNAREDAAAAAGAAIAAIYAAAELLILSALTNSVKRAMPVAAATIAGVQRLRREVAGILAAAEAKARQVIRHVGVPWDYQTVRPVPVAEPGPAPSEPTFPLAQLPPAETASFQVAKQEVPAAATPEPVTPADLPPPPSAQLAIETGQQTGPSIKDMIESVSVRVYRQSPDLYQQAVADAIADTRGGMPQNSLSLSRIQAAQKALDTLTERGITGFTDRAGRDWDLLAYVEMAPVPRLATPTTTCRTQP